MPRLIDPDDELVSLAKVIAKGESVRRQYVFRLDAEMAMRLIRHCQQKGQQPGPVVEDIVSEFFNDLRDGVHLTLPVSVRKAVDKAAEISGQDREDVVRRLVADHIGPYLKSLTESQSSLDALTAEAKPPKKQ